MHNLEIGQSFCGNFDNCSSKQAKQIVSSQGEVPVAR